MSKEHPGIASQNLQMEDHKTIINVDGNSDGVQEEICQKRNMEYKPHICDHHSHITPNKYKSELKINPSFNDNEIMNNLQSQQNKDQTDYSFKLEIKTPLESETKNELADAQKHQPPVYTITVQNKQGSELKNSCKTNKPIASTSPNGTQAMRNLTETIIQSNQTNTFSKVSTVPELLKVKSAPELLQSGNKLNGNNSKHNNDLKLEIKSKFNGTAKNKNEINNATIPLETKQSDTILQTEQISGNPTQNIGHVKHNMTTQNGTITHSNKTIDQNELKQSKLVLDDNKELNQLIVPVEHSNRNNDSKLDMNSKFNETAKNKNEINHATIPLETKQTGTILQTNASSTTEQILSNPTQNIGHVKHNMTTQNGTITHSNKTIDQNELKLSKLVLEDNKEMNQLIVLEEQSNCNNDSKHDMKSKFNETTKNKNEINNATIPLETKQSGTILQTNASSTTEQISSNPTQNIGYVKHNMTQNGTITHSNKTIDQNELKLSKLVLDDNKDLNQLIVPEEHALNKPSRNIAYVNPVMNNLQKTQNEQISSFEDILHKPLQISTNVQETPILQSIGLPVQEPQPVKASNNVNAQTTEKQIGNISKPDKALKEPDLNIYTRVIKTELTTQETQQVEASNNINTQTTEIQIGNINKPNNASNKPTTIDSPDFKLNTQLITTELTTQETQPAEASNNVNTQTSETQIENTKSFNEPTITASPMPKLRSVLTQTSLEPPGVPAVSATKIAPRVGCAESGVLSARVGTGNSSNTVLPPMSSMEEENLRERIHAGLLRQCAENVQREARYTKDTFKRLCQSKEFLEQLFKLFDQDRDNLLHQDDWVEFLKERLSDEKQIDFAEQIESVAYVLCGDEPITLDLFNQIFHAKGIVDKLFRLVDQGNVGTISAEQVMEFVSNITNTRPRTGFDKKSLESLEQLFRQTVGNEKEIRREEFQKIVISKNPFFTERVFQIFDRDNSGSISLQEFLDSMHQFAGQSPDDKIKFLFKIYDIDGDGLIQLGELQHVMRACMEENGMRFSEDQISELSVAMFEDADTNNRGAITYEALKRQLEKHGGLLENLSISIDRWLVPPQPQARRSRIVPYQLTRPYLKNNYVYLIFLAAFIALNVGLFVSRAVQYADLGSNGYVIVARACGQCLNFNCMFVLVLMLRQCITFLRTRGFSHVLPLDHHIYLHKVTGMLIALFSILHTLMHLLNFSVEVVNNPEVNSGNYTLAEWLLTARPGLFGLVPGVANPTGIVLFVILAVMFVCSQAFVRRGGCFEVFYWTHLLYIPFWVLLIFHGPNFWKWFIVPGVVYLIERILRLAWMKSERGKTYISSGLLLPSKVTHLVIKRPLHFDFHPGDYVFVNIPAIAKYEWHPFTISSAPEQEDYMWLHIRAVGEWTNRLYNYFEREQEKLHNGEIPPHVSGSGGGSTSQVEKKVQLPSITSDTTLRRLQASLKRKFSNRDPNRNKGDAQLVRYTHERFTGDTGPHVSASDGEINQRASCSNETLNYPAIPKTLSPEKRLQMLLFHQKVPLEKSLSMPDIQTKAKKRERLLVLREYMRSESEKSFDECQIRRARLQSLGLAYLSPQNKSLAQSFRYMRHKPTIIAFKTPSLENCERGQSSSSLGSVGRLASAGSFASSPERAAEEGKVAPPTNASPTAAVKAVNYPVGKPLEPIPEDRCSVLEVDDLDDSLFTIRRVLGSDTEIYLDGPYGAPSSHIFRAQHAVLIATGIGVTPFASILQSIMHRYWKARHACPRCHYAWASDIPPTVMHLRKVDFFWINRDQRSFEWFVNLLSQLEIEQAELGGAMERFLEMHMYITSALQKTDMKAVGLQLALDLLHEKEKRDLITGLKTRTNAGRPNWDKVFKQLLDQRKGKVTVFYCGPPQLARILRYKCDQYGFAFRKETF